MKWLIVVLFATPTGDVYIFTDPTFDTKEECYTSIQDPMQIPRYTSKLFSVYQKPMPIRGVACLEEDEIKRIMSQKGA